MNSQMRGALAFGPGEGERLNWLGELTVIKVSGDQTDGHYAIAEVVSTPDGFVPLHVHDAEDEAFLIMDGEVDFTVGERTFSAGPGAFVFGPRGVPHSYKVKTKEARDDVFAGWIRRLYPRNQYVARRTRARRGDGYGRADGNCGPLWGLDFRLGAQTSLDRYARRR